MKNFFDKRASQFEQDAAQYGRRARIYSILRILTFLLFISLWIYFLNEQLFNWFLISLLLFPFIFGILVRKHKKINYTQRFLQQLALINREEINRLQYNPQHFYDGTRYQSEEHSYSGDLDVFGKKNLYHYINRAATPAGEDTLAEWLSAPAPKTVILERQKAVAELKSDVAWRQEIQASELEIQKEHQLDLFMTWLKGSDKTPSRILAYGLPIVTIIFIIFWLIGDFTFYLLLIPIIVNGIVLSRNIEKTNELSKMTSQGLSVLKKYRHIIHLIESKKFESPYLLEVQRKFKNQGYRASASLKKLERILEFFDARGNMFYHILNIVFLIDLQLIIYAGSWKKKNKDYVINWFDAIGKTEAICSLAGYAYANPDFAFPEINSDEYILNANELGHPLIPAHERVANDFKIEGKGAVVVITGSNMSGKSTFLRTVGINGILAFAGGPVCAKNLLIGEFEIFTSMRTKDDLEAHVSSFYAELKRIRQLLNRLKSDPKPVLFALDEVLKGTNSHDRHTGAKALVRQLNQQNCMGMVSTHDLELGDLAEEEKTIVNMSFNSDIEDDKILFDYKIHQGTCKSFNASKLMEQMGIDIKKSS